MHVDLHLVLLYSWPSKSDTDSTNPLLPTLVGPKTSTASANEQVEAEITDQDLRRKWGRYHRYSPEVRAKRGKYTAEHGNKAAATKFSRELEHTFNESTIWNIKLAYLRKLSLTYMHLS